MIRTDKSSVYDMVGHLYSKQNSVVTREGISASNCMSNSRSFQGTYKAGKIGQLPPKMENIRTKKFWLPSARIKIT